MYTYNQLYFQYKKLYFKYVKKLVLILNILHGKQYNKDYWEPIIGIYLRRFLINYLLFKNISKNKNLFKKLEFRKINFFKNYREFADARDYENFNKFNLYNFENKKNLKIYEPHKINYLSKLVNNIKIIIPNILIKLGVTKILFFESYFKKNLKRIFYFRTFLNFYPLPNLKLEKYKVNKKALFQNRLRIMDLHKNKIQKDNLLKNIIFFMPINYVENFEIISTEIEKIRLSEAIYIDGNEVSFDFIKFYIANLKMNKKKIIVGQHSFRSGIDDYDIFFDYSKSILNYFLTWGWETRESSIKKFSSLRIFSSLKKYDKVKELENKISKICFILCSYSKLGECLYDNFYENRIAEKSRINLIKRIEKNKGIKISIKPRTGSFILHDKVNFYKKFEILKDKTRMYEIFGKFNIVIFERMSLGIVECIYLNQPTILYYPKNLYKIKNREYRNLLKMLKKANIFFDNLEDIEQLINNKLDISNWWMNKKNINFRNKILKKYANSFNFKDLKKIKNYIN